MTEAVERDHKENKISIQLRMSIKVCSLFHKLEDAILDENYDFSAYSLLQRLQVPGKIASLLANKCKSLLQDLLDAQAGEEQAREAYRHLTKAELQKIVKMVQSMISDCERHAGNLKSHRKIRIKKPLTAEKQVKTLKFLAESTQFKIKSIPSQHIVGAKELWTFNVRNKTLSRFVAIDRGGLGVKGSSITKYDHSASKTYQTGRQTQVLIEKVLNEKSSRHKPLLENGDQLVTDRINKNVVLLKVEK